MIMSLAKFFDEQEKRLRVNPLPAKLKKEWLNLWDASDELGLLRRDLFNHLKSCGIQLEGGEDRDPESLYISKDWISRVLVNQELESWTVTQDEVWDEYLTAGEVILLQRRFQGNSKMATQSQIELLVKTLGDSRLTEIEVIRLDNILNQVCITKKLASGLLDYFIGDRSKETGRYEGPRRGGILGSRKREEVRS